MSSKKYKFIFLIYSTSKLEKENTCYIYNDKYSFLKKYNKLYYDLFKNDIKFFYIECNEIQEKIIIEEGDYIYVKNKDSLIPGILMKSIAATYLINKNYLYDYIIYTNLSTLWNIPVLLSLYEEIPKFRFFGGHVIFNTFISGTGIIISKDLVPLLLKINLMNPKQDYNDVYISLFMHKYNEIPIFDLGTLSKYKMNYQIDDKNIIPNYTDDILYFRIKNKNIEMDITVYKVLIKLLYKIDIPDLI
jgi:hypothetical protein